MRIQRKGNYHKLVSGEEDNTLVVASSGHGKGLLGERIAQEYYKKGWTIITLPSFKKNMEFGYACFKPEKEYHLKALRFQQEESKNMSTKLYHFYTKNFPRTNLPPYNLITMDIKKLDRLLCYFLFEETTETSSLRILLDALNSLKNNEGLKDLLDKIEKRTSKKEEKAFGDVRQLRKISQAFERFRYNPLLFPSNFPNNLDMKKILKDNKHYHIFSSRYINDVKTRDFMNLFLLQEIIRIKQEDLSLKPVCIFIDEIKALCPEHPVYNFKITLNKIISEILSTCRGLGINIISTTQIYNEVASEVRGAFNNLLLGKMTDLKDLNEIAQIIRIDSFSRKEIFSLNYNKFYLLNTGEGIDEGSFLTFLPQHCHCERGYNFDKMYKKYYPEKLKKHIPELDCIAESWKNSYYRL